MLPLNSWFSCSNLTRSKKYISHPGQKSSSTAIIRSHSYDLSCQANSVQQHLNTKSVSSVFMKPPSQKSLEYQVNMVMVYNLTLACSIKGLTFSAFAFLLLNSFHLSGNRNNCSRDFVLPDLILAFSGFLFSWSTSGLSTLCEQWIFRYLIINLGVFCSCVTLYMFCWVSGCFLSSSPSSF